MNREVFTVTVFGASGAQGAPVVEAALAAGHRVRAVSRRRDALESRLGDQADAVFADLSDPGSLRAALDGADSAFVHVPISYGPPERERFLDNVLEAATRSRLPSLVFSTAGHADRRFGDSPVVTGNAEMARRVLSSGVPSVVLAPTVYLENLRREDLAPRLRSEGVLDYPPLPEDRPFSWTATRDQARLAVAALGRADLRGRVHEIATPGALTGPELAALAVRWLARPVRFVSTTPEQFGARLAEHAVPRPVSDALVELYRGIERLPAKLSTIDTDALEASFRVKLTRIDAHVLAWPRVEEAG